MKTARIAALLYFILVLLIIVLPSSALVTKEGKPRLNIGYSSKAFLDVDIKDASAALNVWVNEWSEKEGFTAENHIYDDMGTFVKDFRNNKLDFGIVKSLDYLRIRNQLDTELAFTHAKGGKKTIKYLLLVRSDSGVSDVMDLRNRKLTLRKGDDIGRLFLNTYLLKNKQPEVDNFFGSVEQKGRSSQVVLSVFFGQADACIISDLSLKTMTELNPQVGEKLKIIASSPEFIEGVNFFRKGYDEKNKTIVLDRSKKLKDTARGKQIMLLFKFEEVVSLQERDLETLKKLMHEYERLKINIL